MSGAACGGKAAGSKEVRAVGGTKREGLALGSGAVERLSMAGADDEVTLARGRAGSGRAGQGRGEAGRGLTVVRGTGERRSGASVGGKAAGSKEGRAVGGTKREGLALGSVRACPYCGERFERRASRQRFCSQRCRRDWDNMRGRAERELARLEREAETEEQRRMDAARELIHAGQYPIAPGAAERTRAAGAANEGDVAGPCLPWGLAWPDGLSSYGGIDPWARSDLDDMSVEAIAANALLDPMPVF